MYQQDLMCRGCDPGFKNKLAVMEDSVMDAAEISVPTNPFPNNDVISSEAKRKLGTVERPAVEEGESTAGPSTRCRSG